MDISLVFCCEDSIHGKMLQTRSMLAVTLAVAISLLGLAKLLHGDAILAVFAAGLALNWLIGGEEGYEKSHHEHMQETMKRFFDVPIFVFFGMILPVNEWLQEGLPLLLFCFAILLFRRLPVLLLLYRFLKPVERISDALFVGWFGPIAVAAMVYATWANVQEGYERLWHLGSCVIFVSILIHGITATPFTRWYTWYNTRYTRKKSQERQ